MRTHFLIIAAILVLGIVSAQARHTVIQKDKYLIGDFDGDGRSEVAYQNGGAIHLDFDQDGYYDKVSQYGHGSSEDQYLVGDWNGDGKDNIAVRRGNQILMDYNWDGLHDRLQTYGKGNSEDEYLVGDWNGDGKDNIAVRRGNQIIMDFNFDSARDHAFYYGSGSSEDQYLVGDWNGDGKDNIAVRRGNQIIMDYNFDGASDKTQSYGSGNTEAGYYAGDWNGGGRDRVAVRKGKQFLLAHDFDGRHDAVYVSQEAKNNGFYMLFASDSQYPWTETSMDESQKQKVSTKLNQDHVKSMNTLTDRLGKVKGVIINGDLTAYGHGWQLNKFQDIYKNLKVKQYLGLGNHDYANNVDDCYENACANNMVEFMIEHIKQNRYPYYDYSVSESYQFPSLVKTINGSLAYSWDEGNVHFVQLQNFPTYTASWTNYVSGAAKRKTVNIKSAMQWLEKDLARARNAGKAIILNYHDSDEHWSDPGMPNVSGDFHKILEKYGVSAVFVGHYHSSIGKAAVSRRFSYGKVPVFYCGAASTSKYLSVKFTDQQMTVTRMSSTNGEAKAIGSAEVYPLNTDKPSTPVAAPKEDVTITFFNEAGYVSRYSLSYKIDGRTKSHNTGNMALGNKKRFTVPGGATNIKVKGEGQTGLIWEPWRVTFDRSYSTASNICFKSYGTTLHQQWNNNCN